MYLELDVACFAGGISYSNKEYWTEAAKVGKLSLPSNGPLDGPVTRMSSIILVTGGAGFIGQNIVRRLLHEGHRVRVLDLRPSELSNPQLEECVGSILDQGLVDKAMKGVDRVIHTAANSQLWSPDKSSYQRVNVEGTRMILEAAAQRGVDKFVYTSTEAILLNGSKDHVITEKTPLPPLKQMPGPYTRSKWLAERQVRKAAREGFPAVIVYPTAPLGAGDVNMTAPTRMIQSFASSPPPFFLDCQLNMVAVQDVAEGHLRAAWEGNPGERFLLGGENLRLSDLLNLLHECGGPTPPQRTIPYPLALIAGGISQFIADRITGRTPLAALEGVLLAGKPIRCDMSHTRRRLGLPRTSLRKAVNESLDWLRSTGRL